VLTVIRALSLDEMMLWTSCETRGGGDFLDWETHNWVNENNMTSTEEDFDQLCTPHVPG
jgi:hypothetical protein